MKTRWLILIPVLLFALKLVSQTPRPIPVINLDAGPHEITAHVNCDGARVTSIDVYVDGHYLMTTVTPPTAPTALRLIP